MQKKISQKRRLCETDLGSKEFATVEYNDFYNLVLLTRYWLQNLILRHVKKIVCVELSSRFVLVCLLLLVILLKTFTTELKSACNSAFFLNLFYLKQIFKFRLLCISTFLQVLKPNAHETSQKAKKRIL
jgi:hypothetical protein